MRMGLFLLASFMIFNKMFLLSSLFPIFWSEIIVLNYFRSLDDSEILMTLNSTPVFTDPLLNSNLLREILKICVLKHA